MKTKSNFHFARRISSAFLFLLVLAACQAPAPTNVPPTVPPAPTASVPPVRPSATLPVAPTRTPSTLGDPTAVGNLNLSGNFVFAPGDGSIWIREAKSGSTRNVVKAGADTFAESPVLSPDGKMIAYSLTTLKKDGTIPKDVRVVNVDGTNTRVVANPEYPKIVFDFPDWNPDGKELFITQSYPVPPASEYSEIDRIPIAAGGTPKKVIEGRSPSVSGDGKKIAFLRFDYQSFTSSLWVATTDGKNEKKLVDNDTFLAILGPRMSPDGELVLFAASGPPNKKLPGVSFYQPRKNDACAFGFAGVCFIENAFADGLPWDLWTVKTDGSKFEQVTNVGTDSPYPAWSPDGKFIAFFDVTGIYVLDREKKVIYTVMNRGGHGGFDWK